MTVATMSFDDWLSGEFEDAAMWETRLLDETNDDEDLIEGNDSLVLRNTLRVYGGLFLILTALFCILRKRFKAAYNVRNTVEELKTEIAEDQFGFISWIWKCLLIPEDEIFEECGMDALCFGRALYMGYKVALLGMVNAIWLMAIYGTAEQAEETDYITDPIVSISISHVPAGSPRMIGTVVAAYTVFGYTMYLILEEMKWFTKKRHEFLSKRNARNYSVYVRGVPPEYRSSRGLEEYFSHCFSNSVVLEGRIALKVPALAKQVAAREGVVASLEHAINLEQVKGIQATHRDIMGKRGARVNSVETYREQLEALNEDITQRIETIEARNNTRSYELDLEQEFRRVSMASSLAKESSPGGKLSTMSQSSGVPGSLTLEGGQNHSTMSELEHGTEPETEHEHEHEIQVAPIEEVPPPEDFSKSHGLTKSIMNKGTGIISKGNKLLSSGNDNVLKLASSAAALVLGGEDGEPHEAGFVTFTSLRTVHSALQMTHHPTPFVMEVLEAPEPEDVFWKNVGKTHKELQVGRLLSFALTAALCLLWTIPMSTAASLSTVDKLKAEVEFVAYLIEKAPWLEGVLALLAPLFVVILNALLPIILESLSMMEGPVSGATVQASLFVKLAAFMIIQTFFVSAISGALLSELSNFIRDPTPNRIIDLLANSLPSRSTYFIQILLVSTFLGMALELLRVVPIAIAAIRRLVGPNLTEKERNTTWMGLRPLADPDEFDHASVFSQTLLYFMVFFVYTTIAPITNFFMAFCFLLMSGAYRHQFVYIYPHNTDSGGKLWVSFIGIVLTCMIIAQFTIVGLLALKKATMAGPLMFPLLIMTGLFSMYIRQKHFRVTENLPSRECLKMDLEHAAELDFDFVRRKYLQPELQDMEVYPENMDVLPDNDHQMYMTPPHSEADVVL